MSYHYCENHSQSFPTLQDLINHVTSLHLDGAGNWTYEEDE